MTIPNVTAGTDIEASWGNAVADAINDATPEAWTAPAFQNSWFSYGGALQDVHYRKIGDRVQIRGVARKDATFAAGQTIFTLPAGYRPPDSQLWSVLVYGNVGGGVGEYHERVDVLATGEVQVSWASSHAAGNWVSFHHEFSVL